MSFWVKVTLSQGMSVVPLVTDWDYRCETEPTTTAMGLLCAQWASTLVPIVNAVQDERVRNVRVKAVWRGNTAVQSELSLPGGGLVEVIESDQQVTSASITIKKFVSETNDFDDNPYTDEPKRYIQEGFVFVPGASDQWITGGLSVVPTALTTEMTALLAMIIDPVDVAGNSFIPIVHGFALSAIGGSNPRAARPEVYADVEGASFKWITWHESRQNNSVR